MAELSMRDIVKVYEKDGVQAVTDFNLEVKDREFVVFVGPSGCGKSTTLRMIAGLEEITSGELYIDGKLMNDVAPKDRDIAMVFQNYALYPHMNVYDNMAFGLKLRKFKKDEIERRVNNAAEILGLEDYLDRKPAALSGGQRQRVALGRAIVRDAKVFLMDEPLSNLDAKLRVQMRTEIARLHNTLNTTTIYVTHDQTEAMTLATRIVILDRGLIQQIGSPREVYDHPVNMFVAGFMGSPAMNFFNVTYSNGRITDGKEIDVEVYEPARRLLEEKGYEGKDVVFGIRPEDINAEQVALDLHSESHVNAEVVVSELMGSETMLHSKVGDTTFVARVDARDTHGPGEMVELAFNMNKGHFFDVDTEEVIKK